MISKSSLLFFKPFLKHKILVSAILVCLFITCKKKAEQEVIPVNNEPAEFLVSIQNISSGKKYNVQSFNDILPDRSDSFIVNAPIGTKFSLVTKLKHSNDICFAPQPIGIPLYVNSLPIPAGSEVNTQVKLWDCGLYKNTDAIAEAPDANNTVRLVGVNKDGFYYPDVNQILSVIVEYLEETKFRITIKNLGASASLATGNQKIILQKGLLILHSGNGPSFVNNSKPGVEFSNFIKSPSTDNTFYNQLITAKLVDNSAAKINISKGVWCVHNPGTNPLFTVNAFEYKKGLADKGVSNAFLNNLNLASGVLSAGIIDSTMNGRKDSIQENESFLFKIKVRQGDHFSFATKLLYPSGAQDELFAFSDEGIIPYNNLAFKLNGDVTPKISIYDLGNSINSSVLKDTVTKVHQVSQDREKWPAPTNSIRVTIKPLN